MSSVVNRFTNRCVKKSERIRRVRHHSPCALRSDAGVYMTIVVIIFPSQSLAMRINLRNVFQIVASQSVHFASMTTDL